MSTAVAVCSRINHPQGYGSGDERRTAHGYVTLLVTGLSGPEALTQLRERLRIPVKTPFGQSWHDWYGGEFDVVALIPSNGEPMLPDAFGPITGVRSYGDNRALACVTFYDMIHGDHSPNKQP